MMKKLLRIALAAILLLATGGVLLAQNRVTGSVKDANGEPIIGASVLLKGSTSVGTVTDATGAFSLSVPDNAVLVASCIGYSGQEIALSRGQREANFVLSEDTEFLDETVVIGYGTQKKSDVTGSVASVDSESMLQRSPLTIAQGLQGAAAGVVVTQSGGDPNGGYLRIERCERCHPRDHP